MACGGALPARNRKVRTLTRKQRMAALLGLPAAIVLLVPGPAQAGGLLPSQTAGELVATVEGLTGALGGVLAGLTTGTGELIETALSAAGPSAGRVGGAVAHLVTGAGHALSRTTTGAGHAVSRLVDRSDDLIAETTGIDLLPEEPALVASEPAPRIVQPKHRRPAPRPRARSRPAPQRASDPVPAPARPEGERHGASARRSRLPSEDGGLQAVKDLAFPIVLALAACAFLLLQHYIDRRDPKLAQAPLDDDLLSFT